MSENSVSTLGPQRGLSGGGGVSIRANSGPTFGPEPRINFLPGGTVTLAAGDDPGNSETTLSIESSVAVRRNDVPVGVRSVLNFIEGAGVAISAVDDGPNGEIDLTFVSQGLNVRANNGPDQGPRRRINFIDGANVTISAVDDAIDGEVDVTISAAGGGGAEYVGSTETVDGTAGITTEPRAGYTDHFLCAAVNQNPFTGNGWRLPELMAGSFWIPLGGVQDFGAGRAQLNVTNSPYGATGYTVFDGPSFLPFITPNGGVGGGSLDMTLPPLRRFRITVKARASFSWIDIG